MSEALRTERLYRSEVVCAVDARCRPHDSCPGSEECTSSHEIVFPRAGFFVRHVGRETTAADAGGALFFRRFEPYRVSHPIDGGDDCTSLSFAPAVLADAFAAYDPSVLDHPEEPFRASWAPLQSPTALLLYRFRAAVRSVRGTDPALRGLVLDESALRLLDAVARDAARLGKRAERRERPDTRRAHRALAEDTRAVLSEDISAPLTLPDIARRVHSSPFHLARLFRRWVGLPIHKYLARLRLRAALQQLFDGESDLTRLAFSVGFSSHSHFSDAFRREFGHSPSSVRSELTEAGDFETSKNLKA